MKKTIQDLYAAHVESCGGRCKRFDQTRIIIDQAEGFGAAEQGGVCFGLSLLYLKLYDQRRKSEFEGTVPEADKTPRVTFHNYAREFGLKAGLNEIKVRKGTGISLEEAQAIEEQLVKLGPIIAGKSELIKRFQGFQKRALDEWLDIDKTQSIAEDIWFNMLKFQKSPKMEQHEKKWGKSEEGYPRKAAAALENMFKSDTNIKVLEPIRMDVTKLPHVLSEWGLKTASQDKTTVYFGFVLATSTHAMAAVFNLQDLGFKFFDPNLGQAIFKSRTESALFLRKQFESFLSGFFTKVQLLGVYGFSSDKKVNLTAYARFAP